MRATGVIVLEEPSPSVADLRRRIDAGRLSVGIVIPADFERRRLEHDRAAVQLLVDGSEPMIDGIARSLASTPIPGRTGMRPGWTMESRKLKTNTLTASRSRPSARPASRA